jgi:hypothetical protein
MKLKHFLSFQVFIAVATKISCSGEAKQRLKSHIGAIITAAVSATGCHYMLSEKVALTSGRKGEV